VEKGYTHFDLPLLSSTELEDLRELGKSIGKILPGTPGIQGKGPFDVELGFKEAHIWLFQVRPYVENKRAQSAAYLQALDPEIPKNVRIKLSVERIEG
jgi:hypothetical protein